MALKVWLPLNGNINNQGADVSNIIIKDAANLTYGDGKIGKAMSFVTTNQISIVDTNYRLNSFSVTIWFKVAEATARQTIFHDGREYNTFGYGAYLSTDYKLTVYCGNKFFTYATALTKELWYHVALTYNSGTFNVYLNGELLKTDTGTPSYTESSGHINIGLFSHTTLSNIAYAFKGMLNDFRFYDECLSDKQVKEISKGLVAHYKLSMPGKDNLLKHAEKYTINNKLNRQSASTDGYIVPGIYYNGLDTSKYYIYSVCCDGTLNTSHGALKTPSENYWTIWLYYNDTEYTDSSYSGYKTPTCYASSSTAYMGRIGNRYYWKFKPPYANCSVRLNTYSDGTTATNVNFWDIKLEEGEQLTPWLPNKSDTLYTKLGYDKILNQDSSGYGYHGVIGGTLYNNNDTPRHQTSTRFGDGNTGYLHKIKTPLNSTLDSFTYSIWYYPTTATGNAALYNCRSSVGEGFSLFLLNGTHLRFDTGGSYQWDVGAPITAANKWYHIVVTYNKNTGKKCYINGSLFSSTTSAGTLVTLSTLASIGISSSGGDGSGNLVYGSLSDARLYCTELSANDVLTLYKNCGIIDNKGNTYAYDFVEEA